MFKVLLPPTCLGHLALRFGLCRGVSFAFCGANREGGGEIMRGVRIDRREPLMGK